MASATPFRHARYRLSRLLGEGGMGRVYLAEDRLDGNRQVALKVYPSRFSDERLRREFVALRELRHPGIARALHFGLSEENGAPFFTLEYIQGKPLTDALWGSFGKPAPDGPAPSTDFLTAAVSLLRQTATALAYLHRRDVLHLDVKPENILLCDTDVGPHSRPLLIDFGLVRAVGGAGAPVGHATLPYAPPEILDGEAPAPTCDVYSLAATFYHVFHGAPPVAGRDLAELSRAHRGRQVCGLPTLPRALERVLLRALAKNPSRRYNDAVSMAHALEDAAVGPAPSASPVAFHEPDFVGRKVELTAARAWLDEDRRSSPILAFSGGGGWGKTRLLERIETDLELAAKKTLLIRCQRDEGRELLTRVQDGAAILSPTAPAETTAATETSPQREEQPDLEAAINAAASDLLPLLSSDTFLIVDDLHHAGAAGHRLVTLLAERMSQQPELPGGGILLSERSPQGRPHAVERELGPLVRREALRIELDGLAGALAGLSSDRIRRLKSSLYEAVGGHPLFFVRGLLDLAGETASAEALAPTARLRRQLEQLNADERDLIRALVCLDRQVPIAEIESVLDRQAGSLNSTLDALRRAGWIVVDRNDVRVIHDSVTTTVLDSMDGTEQKAVHRRIARALEGGRSSSSIPGRLLQSAWHAARAGDMEHAGKLCRLWAARPSSIPEALVSRAADVLTACAERAGKDREGRRKLLRSAADLLEGSGRYLESCRLLTTQVRAADAENYGLRRKVGSLALRAGDTHLATQHLGACVRPRACEKAPEESIHAAAELALLHHFEGRTEAALKVADGGVARWKTSPRKIKERTRQSAAKLHGILGQVHLRRLDFEPAIKRLSAGLRLAEASSSKPNIALLLNNLALAHHLAGRFTEALATFERAETLARELGDHAALVSITANVVQIHAKRGRFQTAATVLDELERSAAARQSPRLRLGCLYSRGLLENLHHGHADEVWKEVRQLAESVKDGFLAQFALLYRAEGAIFRGQWLEARVWLKKTSTPQAHSAQELHQVHDTLRGARQAAVEGLLGQAARSLRLQKKYTPLAAELPAMLLAWTQLYLGIAAVETKRYDAAETAFKNTARVFDATDFAVGQLECAVARADLHFVQAATAPEHKRLALRELEIARTLAFEPHDQNAVRDRELRLALLEARALCLDLERWISGDHLPEDLDALERNLSDLLARVGGDAALKQFPHLQLELETYTVVAQRLRGDCGSAWRICDATEKQRSRRANKLPAAERAGFLACDVWQRLGLPSFSPVSATVGSARTDDRTLEQLIDTLSSDGVGNALRIVAEALAASRVEFLALSQHGTQRHGTQHEGAVKSGRKPRGRAPAATPIFCFLRHDGHCLGLLKASRATAFSRREQTLVETAAKVIAVLVAPALTVPSVPERSQAPTQAIGEKTATLPLTQTLGLRSPSSLSEILKEEGVVCAGRQMRRVLATVERLAVADVPILITGESGTGKDVVARLLHRASPRGAGPFISQNANALPEELFEADLFGYEQGAFTGAEQKRTGFLFRATGGTFHLEEVGDLPPVIQQRLLRVLEDNVVRPLGATSTRTIDVRFLASTHCDLEALVHTGAFRKDLFYRLCGAKIHVPPLRERLDEIPALAEHFWKQLTSSSGRFPASTRRALQQHAWPGNVRELITVLRRLSLETTSIPSAGDVRKVLGEGTASDSPFSTTLFETRSYSDLKRRLDETHLRHLFETHGGNLERIATELRTTTRSVYRKFARLGLKPKDFTGGARETGREEKGRR